MAKISYSQSFHVFGKKAEVQSLKTQQFVRKVHTRVLSESSQTQKSRALYDSHVRDFLEKAKLPGKKTRP